MKLNGVSFNIDILNSCCLACPSCAVGAIGRRKGGLMSIELFRQIMDKAQRECKVRKVQLYAYSDPCLHPDLHLFVAELSKRGIVSTISTMLQTTHCDFAKVIEARPTEFRISFPGWEQMSYYQSRYAQIERFEKKIEEVCGLPRYKETNWTMAFHLYKDNGHEVERAKALAKKHGLHIVILPAIFMVNERVVEKNYSEKDKELIAKLIETPEESISRMKFETDYCILWKQITIDATGMVYLCQIVYEDRFKIVNFLEMPLPEIMRRIRTHHFCDGCMKQGGHTYQQCYDDAHFHKDPVAMADKRRRIGGKNPLLDPYVKAPDFPDFDR